MREKRGSIDAFLEQDLGLGDAERNRLRALLLEPIPDRASRGAARPIVFTAAG